MRVLIVDDEPSIRKTTRIAVESAGHSAVEAPNAAKAVKAAESEGFDAVFLDLKLGADDGMEVPPWHGPERNGHAVDQSRHRAMLRAGLPTPSDGESTSICSTSELLA